MATDPNNLPWRFILRLVAIGLLVPTFLIWMSIWANMEVSAWWPAYLWFDVLVGVGFPVAAFGIARQIGSRPLAVWSVVLLVFAVLAALFAGS